MNDEIMRVLRDFHCECGEITLSNSKTNECAVLKRDQNGKLIVEITKFDGAGNIIGDEAA